MRNWMHVIKVNILQSAFMRELKCKTYKVMKTANKQSLFK